MHCKPYFKPQYSVDGEHWYDYGQTYWCEDLAQVQTYALGFSGSAKKLKIRIVSVVETIEVVEVL